MIEDGGYTPSQVFNLDETGLLEMHDQLHFHLHIHLHQLWPEEMNEFRGFMEAQVSEARQQIVDMALQVRFEEIDKDDVEVLLSLTRGGAEQ